MQIRTSLTAADAAQFQPRDFVVNAAGGERLSDAVRDWLDPANGGSLHAWNLAKAKATALHYHDYDEYWLWTRGRTMLEIRLPDARHGTFEIAPGWIVYCVRGVEHGHQPLEDWGCYECVGDIRPGARPGHLKREM